jgi:FkbM family methyltransferase
VYFLLKIRPTFLASFIKKLLRIKREILNTDQGIFFIDKLSNFGSQLKLKGIYESDLKFTLDKLLKKGDTFIDLGANEGYFSIIAGKLVGNKGRVIAIEPQTRLQNIIHKNIELNKLSNIEIIKMVISDKKGKEIFNLSPDTNTGSSGVLKKQSYKVSQEIIDSTTLKELISQLKIKKIDLLKIDVEGSEYEVILGSKTLFESHIIKNIALELHPEFLKKRNLNINEITDFLYKIGYKINTDFKNLVYSV